MSSVADQNSSFPNVKRLALCKEMTLENDKIRLSEGVKFHAHDKSEINLNRYQRLRFREEKVFQQLRFAHQLQQIGKVLSIEAQHRLRRLQFVEYVERREQITGERAILVRQRGHHEFAARPNVQVPAAHPELPK